MRGVSELYFNPDNRIKHPNLTAEHTVELSHGQTLAKLQSLEETVRVGGVGDGSCCRVSDLEVATTNNNG